MMYPRGWIKAVFTYKCKWCKHEEVVTVTQDEGYILDWIYDGATGAMNLCSTDCQKERDACINKTLDALEPQPKFSGTYPPGYQAKFEELRYEALKMRGLSRRITDSKL